MGLVYSGEESLMEFDELTKKRYLSLFIKRNALGITKEELKQMQSLFDDPSLMIFLQWLKQKDWLVVKNGKLYLTDDACNEVQKIWSNMKIDYFGSVTAVDVKDCFDFPVDFKSMMQENGQITVQVNYLSDQSGQVTSNSNDRLIVDDWRTAKDLTTLTGVTNHSFTKLEPRVEHEVHVNVNSLFV